MKKLKTLILVGLNCLLIGASASAQKLPTVQQVSLHAPKNIKIDGKTTEWNNQFQALNHNVDAYYTIANDADNLYLIVQPKDATIAKKAIVWGIVFSITHARNNYDQCIIVGSPLIPESEQVGIMQRYSEFKEYADHNAKPKQLDSLLLIANNELTKASKEIALGGIKETGSTISVYNEFDIKTILLFDKNGALNYELAIPLKYLNIPANSQPSFFYELMIKGMADHAKIVKSKTGETATVTDIPIGMSSGRSSDTELLMNNTSFWGQYTLAR
jgi:hypothetical protein